MGQFAMDGIKKIYNAIQKGMKLVFALKLKII